MATRVERGLTVLRQVELPISIANHPVTFRAEVNLTTGYGSYADC